MARRLLAKFKVFLLWWHEGISLLIPDAVWQRLRQKDPVLLLIYDKEQLHCIPKYRSMTHNCESRRFFYHDMKASIACTDYLRRMRVAGYELVLLLPPDQVLQRRLSLPQAVGEDLRQVLEFEMDRLTPFSADQVYFDFKVLNDQDDCSGLIEFNLAIVPRSRMDSCLSGLTDIKTLIDRIDIQNIDGMPAGYDLFAHDQRYGGCGTRIRRELILWLLAVGLLLFYLYLPVVKQRQYIDILDQAVTAERNTIARFETLARERDTLLQLADSFSNEFERIPPAIELLDELTRLLPDDTWLQRLTLAGNTIQLAGESSNSSTLIGILQSSPYFTEAKFQSPVTHNNLTERERYHLSVQIAQIGHGHQP